MGTKEKIVDTDKWNKLKAFVKKRDNFTCLYCYQKKQNLTVKQVYFRSNKALEDHRPSDFITICNDCLNEERGH